MIVLTACKFEIDLNGTDDFRDVWRLQGFNKDANKVYWPSPVTSYEIDHLDVIITTQSNSVYRLVGVAFDNSFIQDLNDVIENKGYSII